MSYCLWKSFDYMGSGLEVLKSLKDERFVFFLDSSLYNPQRGRYSFIGWDPFDVFESKGQNTLQILRNKFKQYQKNWRGSPEECDCPSPFPAGIVGFLGYDFGLYLENIKLRSVDDLNLPDCLFGFYDAVITVDHAAHKLYISSTGLPETNLLLREKRAQQRLEQIVHKLSSLPKKIWGTFEEQFETFPDESILSNTHRNFTKETYCEAIQKALEYIRRGDIYQVNLSQRFTLARSPDWEQFDAIKAYQWLRLLSSSHFGGYFDGGRFKILSSSPERFLCLEGCQVQTLPMKGTRPRGKNFLEDKKYREELLNSAKEKAELLMITDLERNDLGRVCEFGSIRVQEMRTIEPYRTVFQATSTVEGILQEERDGFDLLSACFPGGSITGCPKIRAMEIIEELEPTRRGLYTGCLGYMTFEGNMDFNILIRTILMCDQRIHFQVGGGIVADSIPEKEYQETLVKAKAMVQCLNQLFTYPYSASKK